MGLSNEIKPPGAKRPKEVWESIRPKDQVVAPQHYADRKYQSILVIQDTLTVEEFKGFLKGNALKYLSRSGKKDKDLQEYNKASVYLQWLKEVEEFGEMQKVPEYK